MALPGIKSLYIVYNPCGGTRQMRGGTQIQHTTINIKLICFGVKKTAWDYQAKFNMPYFQTYLTLNISTSY